MNQLEFLLIAISDSILAMNQLFITNELVTLIDLGRIEVQQGKNRKGRIATITNTRRKLTIKSLFHRKTEDFCYG